MSGRGAAALAFTPDGAQLVTADGGTVSVWRELDLVRSRECFGHNIHVLAISPDGTRVALGGDEPVVRVCELATLAEVAMVAVKDCAAALVWSGDGRRLHVLDRGRRVGQWEFGGELTDAAFDGPEDIAADAAGRLLVGAARLTLRVRDQAGRTVRDIGTGLSLGLTRVALTPDGALVAAGSLEGEVAVWDVASGRQVWLGGLGSDPVESLKFSADGRMLAAGKSAENPASYNVVLWDAGSGRIIRRWQLHGGFFNDLAFRPDGRRLASCSGSEIVILEIA